MDTVPWRRRPGGLDRPPPDEPMNNPVLHHKIFNEQHERQCISIQETIAKHREISNKVKADNSRIQAERHIMKMAGCLHSDDSDEEPWKKHMDDKHKCMACNKPFWEWRLGQKECEMCQLHEGWNKGFDSKEDKATRNEEKAARSGSCGDEPTAQPEAMPKAKPRAKPRQMPWHATSFASQGW